LRIIIAGAGKIGYQVARQALALGYEVAFIELDPLKAERIKQELDVPVIVGNGTHPQSLRNAGAQEVDLVIALTGDDQDNLVICQLAERQFKAKRTLALVNTPGNEKLFQWLGVNQVIGPASLILGLIQQQLDMDATTALWRQGIKDLN